MPFLYILKSLKNSKYYIGSTMDLNRRYLEHKKGFSKYTKLNRPYEIVFIHEFIKIRDAQKAEKKLKSFKSRKIIERIVEDQVLRLKTG